MAKARLSDGEVDKIVAALAGWEGKLSWELLVEHVDDLLGRPFTRQGLDKQFAVANAFTAAKERLRARRGKSKSTGGKANVGMAPELATALKRVETLLAENASLRVERERYRETFARWLFHARNKGMSERELNVPLEKAERNASEKAK